MQFYTPIAPDTIDRARREPSSKIFSRRTNPKLLPTGLYNDLAIYTRCRLSILSYNISRKQFSWIKSSRVRVYGILKFRELNLRGLLGILENSDNYAPRKFGRIRYQLLNYLTYCLLKNRSTCCKFAKLKSSHQSFRAVCL